MECRELKTSRERGSSVRCCAMLRGVERQEECLQKM